MVLVWYMPGSWRFGRLSLFPISFGVLSLLGRVISPPISFTLVQKTQLVSVVCLMMGLFLLCPLLYALGSKFHFLVFVLLYPVADLVCSQRLWLCMMHIFSSCNTVTAGLCLDGGSFFCPSFDLSIGIVAVLEGTGCFSSLIGLSVAWYYFPSTSTNHLRGIYMWNKRCCWLDQYLLLCTRHPLYTLSLYDAI